MHEDVLRPDAVRPDLVAPRLNAACLHPSACLRRMKFSQINEAFELLHKGDALRCVLTFE